MIEIQRTFDAVEGRTIVAVRLDDVQIMDRYLPEEVARMIAEKVAERYVNLHFAEIAALLNQDAIANLAIAEASQRIAKVIHERPVVLAPTHKTTINKHSIF